MAYGRAAKTSWACPVVVFFRERIDVQRMRGREFPGPLMAACKGPPLGIKMHREPHLCLAI
jgi:hypothetical protein